MLLIAKSTHGTDESAKPLIMSEHVRLGNVRVHGWNPRTALTNAKLKMTAADKTVKAVKRFMVAICCSMRDLPNCGNSHDCSHVTLQGYVIDPVELYT